MARYIFLLLSFNICFSQQYNLYVASESDDTVSVLKFDGESIVETDRITVGIMPTEIEGPHGITIDPEGEHWYLSLAHGSPNGYLVKYSTDNNEPLSRLELGLFPATMQISPTTGLLYVVNFNLHGLMKTSTVSVVDPLYMVEVTKIKTGIMPHGSRISKDGKYHYSVAMMSGELFEIDAMDLSVNRILSLDNNNNLRNAMHHSKIKPTWVTPGPENDYVYVAGNGSDEILKVDLNKWKITDRIQTGKGPYNLEVSPNGKYLLASIKGEGKTGVWMLDDLSFVKNIDNSGSVSHGIVISPDSKYAFISLEGIGGDPGIVDVISLDRLKVVSSVEVGKQAGGIAFWKMED